MKHFTFLDTISELTTFIGKSTSWEADEGCHDDLLMTCVLFSWLVQQRYFKEMTDQDIREKMFSEQMKIIEEELVPFGIINDGNEWYEFQVTAPPPDLELNYTIYPGNNLVSYIGKDSLDVSLAIPDSVEYNIDGFIGEGLAASQLSPGFWVGSLTQLNHNIKL